MRPAKRALPRSTEVNFPLLADEDHEVAEKYGVWQKKSLYGRQFMGIARTTYLIDSDGKIKKRWDNVKVDGHAEDVLKAVRDSEQGSRGSKGSKGSKGSEVLRFYRRRLKR